MTTVLQDLEVKIAQCLHGLSPAQVQAGPPGRWSVQQIVEHLILTYEATTEVLTARIAKGRPTQARPTLWQHCTRLWVVRLGYFPSGVRAPDAVTPPATTIPQPGDDLAARAAAQLRRLEATLEHASELFGAETRSVSHVVLGPLSPAEWRRFHTIHGRHHLSQIETIKRTRLQIA